MNSKYEVYKKRMDKKKVAIIGLGVSNTPLVKQLAGFGANVTVCDRAGREKLADFIAQLKNYDVDFRFGEDYLKNLSGLDYIFRTPGMRYDLPELAKAGAEGSVVTSEMEVFMELCPAQIVAVTGSDGKTTTTTLISSMLKQQGYKCWLGGNIGKPLLSEIESIKPEDMVVLELSSFQLHTMRKSADIAVITNLSPNHLDVHKSMEEYVAAKKNIFIHQNLSGRVVLNFDNEITRAMAPEARGEVVFFSRLQELDSGAMYKDGILKCREKGRDIDIIPSKDIVIPGVHNIENYLAAIAAVEGMVETENIRKVAMTFRGVEHRREPVRELNGVRFYNDSIASSPTRASATLSSFNEKVILIAGGKDKKIPYDPMGELIINKVKKLILIGQTGPMIEEAYKNELKKQNIKDKIAVIYCADMKEAVDKAYEGAQEGDAVILSPASTSFDMFRNFEERGNIFKRIVEAL